MTARKAVLLDADMTLWRIAHQPAHVWQSVLADLGVEVPPRSGVAALACSRDVLAPGWRALETSGFTNDEAAVRNLWLDVEAAVLHEFGITLGLEVVERELSRRLIRVVRLYPETAGALAHLSHSYRLAIVSNDSEPLLKARYLGTANHIAVALGSIHVGCRPMREICELALSSLDVGNTPMREICELALSSLDVGLHEAVTGWRQLAQGHRRSRERGDRCPAPAQGDPGMLRGARGRRPRELGPVPGWSDVGCGPRTHEEARSDSARLQSPGVRDRGSATGMSGADVIAPNAHAGSGGASMTDAWGAVEAVSSSPKHSMAKPNRRRIRLLAGLGVEGDAHQGTTVRGPRPRTAVNLRQVHLQHRSRVARDPEQPNLRQVHLIHAELYAELRAAGFSITAGQMGENITTRGIDLLGLPRGARLKLGDAAVIEIAGLRNPCRQLDDLQPGLMAAVLERDRDGDLVRKAGVMSIVLAGGDVQPGDPISVEWPPGPHHRLEVV